MVTDFRLVTDPATLRSSGVGPVSGELWLSVDGVPFPAAGWNDLVLVVLKAWAESLLSLRGTIDTSATVHFMEGPYVVELSNAPNGLIRSAGRRARPPANLERRDPAIDARRQRGCRGLRPAGRLSRARPLGKRCKRAGRPADRAALLLPLGSLGNWHGVQAMRLVLSKRLLPNWGAAAGGVRFRVACSKA